MKATHRDHFKLAALTCAIAAGLGLSQTGFAQDAAASDDAELDALLEEVIVTASRREESLQDVAIAVTVIDTQEYADAGFVGMDEILPFVPGVSVVEAGTPYGNFVYMRGINAVLAAGVTSYVDEIPFGSSTVYTTGAPLDGTLLDLGTMDVLKGPQGTLYGASAIGGILKFNTRKPSLEEWTGSASANLSDTNGGGFNQLYRVNLNGPLIKDTLGMSLTAFSEDSSGYVDNVALGIEDWDDYEYYGGSGSLLWAVTDKLEVTVQGMYQNATLEGTSTIQANHADDMLQPGIGAGEPWFGEYETGVAAINPSEYEAQLLGLTIRYDLGFAELVSITSTQELSFGQDADLTVPFAAYADLFFPQNAPHTSAVLEAELGFDKFTQELRLTSESNGKFEWIAGAFYVDEDGFNVQDLIVTPAEDLFYANFPSHYEELSLFGTATWYFTPDFDASFGLRWTDYSSDVELVARGPLVAPLPYSEIGDDVTNYLFNVRYRPSDNTSLYGRVASGYRAGGANFLLLDTSGNPVTAPFYRPDDLVSYEVGVKGGTADGRFQYDVAAFYIDWQDYQIRVTRAGLGVAANAEKASSQGIEATVSYALTEALTATASGAWVNAEMGADEPDLGAPKGEQLPLTPEWQASLGLNYDFEIAQLPARVGGTYRYKGEMPVGFGGYTDANGTYFPPSLPRVELDSYSLVDLNAGITVGAFDFSLYVTNLFDEWAWTHFAPSSTAASTGTPTRPRTIGGVVRWNF